MGSLLGDWPSYDPHNFSQLRPADPSAQPSKLTPVTYHPTHNRTLPPPDQGQKGRNMLYSFRALTDAVPTQIRIGPGFSGTLIVIQACAILLIAVISTEARNILVRQFYKKSEEKLRPKRAASEHLSPDHGYKQPRGAFADGSN